MIDFRYHIVSLISVFLALAVGVVLGAGPLRDAIGSQLNDQVAQLRAEKNQLRDDLDVANGSLNFRDTYLAELAPELLKEQLAGQRVAIVFLEPVTGDELNLQLEAIEHSLNQSQGTVTNVVTLSPKWFDELNAGARQATADRVMDELDDWSGSSDPLEVLGYALGQSLTEESDTGLGELSASARVIRQLFASSDLITVERQADAAAHLVLVVTTQSLLPDEASDEERESHQAKIVLQLSTVRGQAAASRVTVAGPVSHDGDLLTRISESTLVRISTVAGTETYPGQVSIPLALSSSLENRYGHFGQGKSAQTPVPLGRDVSSQESPTAPDQLEFDAQGQQDATENEAEGDSDA